MVEERARHATIGFFLVLLAAFCLLGGFVYLIMALGTPSRLIVAIALIALGLLLLQAGYARFRKANTGTGRPDEADPGDGGA